MSPRDVIRFWSRQIVAFLIVFLNSFFEKKGYYNTDFVGISFKKLRLI